MVVASKEQKGIMYDRTRTHLGVVTVRSIGFVKTSVKNLHRASKREIKRVDKRGGSRIGTENRCASLEKQGTMLPQESKQRETSFLKETRTGIRRCICTSQNLPTTLKFSLANADCGIDLKQFNTIVPNVHVHAASRWFCAIVETLP